MKITFKLAWVPSCCKKDGIIKEVMKADVKTIRESEHGNEYDIEFGKHKVFTVYADEVLKTDTVTTVKCPRCHRMMRNVNAVRCSVCSRTKKSKF